MASNTSLDREASGGHTGPQTISNLSPLRNLKFVESSILAGSENKGEGGGDGEEGGDGEGILTLPLAST